MSRLSRQRHDGFFIGKIKPIRLEQLSSDPASLEVRFNGEIQPYGLAERLSTEPDSVGATMLQLLTAHRRCDCGASTSLVSAAVHLVSTTRIET